MTLHRDQDQEPCGRGAKKASAENTVALFGTEIYNTLTHTSREQSASTGIDRGGGGGKMAERDGNGGWWGVSTGGVIFTPFHSQFSTNDVVSDLTEAAAASAVARFSSLRSSIFAAAGATLPRWPFFKSSLPQKTVIHRTVKYIAQCGCLPPLC